MLFLRGQTVLVARLTSQIFFSKVTKGVIAKWLSNFPTEVFFSQFAVSVSACCELKP